MPSREDALVTLCRLWNAVRFTHPALASESDATWEDALIAVEPMVERDPGDFSQPRRRCSRRCTIP